MRPLTAALTHVILPPYVTSVPMLCQLQEACYSPVPAPAEPLPIQKLNEELRLLPIFCPSHAEWPLVCRMQQSLSPKSYPNNESGTR